MSKKNVGELTDIDLSKLREGAKSDFCYSFALRLRDCLDGCKMTQKELAEKAKKVCSEASVTQYLKAKQEPKAEVILCFSDIFNVSTDYLLGKTNIESVDMDVTKACEYTGLSQEAVEDLRFHVIMDTKESKSFIEFYNAFLSYETSESIIWAMLAYIRSLEYCRFLALQYDYDWDKHQYEYRMELEECKNDYEKTERLKHELSVICLYQEQVDKIQPLNLYRMQKSFMEFVEEYGKRVQNQLISAERYTGTTKNEEVDGILIWEATFNGEHTRTQE